MEETLSLHVIARIRSDFTSKFGIPRQSNLVPEQEAVIVFEPEYRDENALRGLEGYSHLWLIWGFSKVHQEGWSPTVKPPKLGGNKRMGVFATRSPFRPNPLGLSSVKLVRLEKRAGLGTVLVVSGADLMDGSPIYDIKPYLSFTDSHPDAQNGFAEDHVEERLPVEFPAELLIMRPFLFHNSPGCKGSPLSIKRCGEESDAPVNTHYNCIRSQRNRALHFGSHRDMQVELPVTADQFRGAKDNAICECPFECIGAEREPDPSGKRIDAEEPAGTGPVPHDGIIPVPDEAGLGFPELRHGNAEAFFR